MGMRIMTRMGIGTADTDARFTRVLNATRGFPTAFLTPGRTPGTLAFFAAALFVVAAAFAIARFKGRQRGMGNSARHDGLWMS